MRDIIKNPWLQTFSGRVVDLINPTVDDILLIDIAHSLSQLCRFTGSTTAFYSVAQHAVLVSRLVSPQNALWALHHDSSEAFIGDISKPLKLYLNGRYTELEKRFMRVICDKFGMSHEEPDEVAVADRIMLVTERKYLLLEQEEPWPYTEQPLSEKIIPWSPRIAKSEFLARYSLLSREGLA